MYHIATLSVDTIVAVETVIIVILFVSPAWKEQIVWILSVRGCILVCMMACISGLCYDKGSLPVLVQLLRVIYHIVHGYVDVDYSAIGGSLCLLSYITNRQEKKYCWKEIAKQQLICDSRNPSICLLFLDDDRGFTDRLAC